MADGGQQYTIRKGARATTRVLTDAQVNKLSSAGFEVAPLDAEPSPAPPPPTPMAPTSEQAATTTAPTRAESFGRASAQGATMGFGDEGSSALASAFGFGEDALKWIGNKTGARPYTEAEQIPKTYAAGSPYADMRNTMRAENREAQQANPGTYLAGELVGGLAPAALTSRVPLPTPATMGGKMLRGAAEGAVLGGVAGAGHSEADTAAGVAKDAAMTAAAGGVVGGAIPPVAAAGGALARKVAEGARGVADRARVAATGAYGAQIKSLVRDKGDDAIGRYADVIESEGIHKGPTPLPQSWGTYAKNAEQVADDAGQQIAQLSEMANGRVQVDVKPMVDELMEEAVKLEGIRSPAGRKAAEELMDQAAALDKGPMSYDEALRLRRFLDKIAWNEERANNGAAAERAREMAGRVRQAMMSALEAEDPALRKAIAQQNERYEVASWANTMAERRIAQETGNQAVSLPAWIAGSGGLAAVGADGGSSVVGGLAAGAAAQLAKTRGKSAIAGVARGVEGAADTVGDVLTAGATHTPETVAATAPAAARRLAAELPNASAASVASAQSVSGKQTAAERNQTLQERIREVAATDPESLGPFGAQLAAARTPDEFAVRHASLMATDQDYRQRIRRLSERDQEAERRGSEPQQETEQ